MTGGGGVAPPAPQGVIERTDNIKTALTQLAQQVSSSGQGIKSLTWRMNSGDGNAEWTFEFNGTPEEANYLRSFIEGQWRRGGEKVLDITYQLHYDPPLSWDDAGEGWIGRLTRAGLGTQSATIRLELTAVAGGQPLPRRSLLAVRPMNCAASNAAPVIWSWRCGRCRAPPPRN